MDINNSIANFSKMLKETKKENILFTSFILFYLAYMIFLCIRLDMSYDEPYSLTTSANLSNVIRLSYRFEFQPPGYFATLALWRVINDSILFARLLTMSLILLSAFFLHNLARLIFNNIYSKWLIVLFLLNPFSVYSGTEIRLYSMVILLSILATYLFYLIYFHKKKELKILFIIVSTLGVYTQYFFVFLIISLGLILLLKRDWRSLLNYILLSTIVALLFIPNLFYLKEQMEVYPDTLESYSIFDRIKSVLFSSLDFFAINKGMYVGHTTRWMIRIAFFSGYIYTIYKFYTKSQKGKQTDFINLIFIMAQTIFLVFIFIASFSLTNIVFATRYLAILFPFHIILLIVFGIYKNITRNIIFGIYAVYLLIFLFTNFKSPYTKSYDFRSVANFIKHNEKEGEPILFVNNDLTLGLRQLFESDKMFISLPEFQYNYNLYTNYVEDTTQLNLLIKNIKSESSTYFVITGTDLGYLRNKDLTNEMIQSYLKNNYSIPVDTTFEGFYKEDYVRIRRIVKK